MEILAFLAVLAFAAWYVLHGKRDNNVRRPPAKPRADPRQTANPPATPRAPAPFDAATAAPATARRHLTGPAYVVDGDTLRIAKTQIRLHGIDAPELDHPHGKSAKWALVKLCKGHKVRAEITDTDDHGRTVAKCFLPDGTDLSAEMVRQGLAIDWPKFSGGVYRALEVPGARKKMWLADARQKGRMHVWEQFEARRGGGDPS